MTAVGKFQYFQYFKIPSPDQQPDPAEYTGYIDIQMCVGLKTLTVFSDQVVVWDCIFMLLDLESYMIDNALESNIYLQPEVSAHLNISIFICFILIQSDLENLLR